MTIAQTFPRSLSEAGSGRPVVVFASGFAGSAAHRALAERFRVVVAGDAAPAREQGEAAAKWAADQGFEAVGFVGAGNAAASALWAAHAAGDRANAVVLVSPTGLPLDDATGDHTGLRPLLTSVAAPKAVLLGTMDVSVPREAAAQLRRKLSKSNVVLVFGAGADIAADRPEAFTKAAGDFLDRQGRFAFMTESVALT
jgi:pimeloyl-ACP methyl ester carboxylesterase